MTSDDLAAILWVPLLLLMVVAGVLFRRAGGSRAGLQRWARINGYRLVECERPAAETIPERVPRGMGIFYVTVEDASGRLRQGQVRCSVGLSGLLFDEATVSWED